MAKGIVGVITGNGKGKTTSVFGLALRASGWKKKVLIIQFLKKGQYGEIKALDKIPGVVIKQFGQKKLINLKKPSQIDIEKAKAGLLFAQKAIRSKRFDLIILDEINLAVAYHLININLVIELIDRKPKELDLVLTGRKAPKELIRKADLVSQIKNIKHPFQKGRGARKGFEY